MYKAKILKRKTIAEGTMQVVFSVDEKVAFMPGQFILLHLPKLIHFDSRAERYFSIVNSPSEKGIITIATRERDSGFKKTLRELPIGSEVEIGMIGGSFTMPTENEKPLVFIAGGIGITPFMSMLRSLYDTGSNDQITLLYSNRDQKSTAFYEELQEINRGLKNLKIVFTMTEDPNWSGEKRRIDWGFIRNHVPSYAESMFMLVGPPAMVTAVKGVLSGLGVKPENIKEESFTGY